jgi:DNA-binding CsgD family transcriptional regulator
MGTTLAHRLLLKETAKVKSPAKVAPTKSSPATPDEALQQLLGQLIEQARKIHSQPSGMDRPLPSPPSGREQVLLDIVLNGVRCLVLQPEPPAETHGPQRDALVLSPREQEIVRMVIKGYPNKTIAAVLEISTWTVATYLRRIYARLGVGTRASMVARVLESPGRELA